MKITGFTIVRNAVMYDYPVVESIRSILPVVDEFVVSVGQSEDGTLELIRSIQSPKIRIMESHWDDRIRSGGHILAVETDKAFQAISPDTDWAFYLQADEVVHEKYHAIIRQSAERYVQDKKVDGLLFKYLHFYGNYDHIGDSRRWYDHEIRIIRNDPAIRSYRDAQGFRKNGEKLWVKPIEAYIYHYGWVKHPEKQQLKRENFGILWSEDQEKAFQKEVRDIFDYSGDFDSLERFTGTHPEVMKERIGKKNWEVELDTSKKNMKLKNRLLHYIEKKFGKRLFAYRNYRVF